MTSKPSLAEQIGVIDEMIVEQQALARNSPGPIAFRASKRLAGLTVARETLVWLMNNADEIKEFRKGKQE